MTKPPRLRPGDAVGIIAPCYALDEAYAPLLRERFTAKGYRVRFGDNAFRATYGFAASPEERAADFHALLADDTVRMLLFGGGEVGNELLPLLDFDLARRRPKILCSYSDGATLLNAVTARAGLATFYGQSPRTFFDPKPYNEGWFDRVFAGADIPVYLPSAPWRVLRGGAGAGRLIGGYLVNFAVMLGGRYLPVDPNERYLLCIEDHVRFSSPAVVSKYFSHIEQTGFFSQVTGLLFGHYSDEPSPAVDDILLRLARRYRIPVARCEDYGYGENNALLPLGAQARLDADKGRLEFLETLTESV